MTALRACSQSPYSAASDACAPDTSRSSAYRPTGLRACARCVSGAQSPLSLRKRDCEQALTAPVEEIFSSAQGEGIYLGARQIFVRFCGCNLRCGYCDEKAARSKGRQMSARAVSDEISRLARFGPHHSVSLTGGEPLLHADFIAELAPLIRQGGLLVYLETNATLPEEYSKIAFLTDIVSADIKLPSSCGADCWPAHEKFFALAAGKVFAKAVVTGGETAAELERCAQTLLRLPAEIPFIIQPATPHGGTAYYTKNTVDTLLRLTQNRIQRPQVIAQQHCRWGIR